MSSSSSLGIKLIRTTFRPVLKKEYDLYPQLQPIVKQSLSDASSGRSAVLDLLVDNTY
jgi:hypothetical protein